jgi:hypothetical protein
MLLEGQSFIDAQDELSVLEFMKKYGMPERINEEIFIAMGKGTNPAPKTQHLASSTQTIPVQCRLSRDPAL